MQEVLKKTVEDARAMTSKVKMQLSFVVSFFSLDHEFSVYTFPFTCPQKLVQQEKLVTQKTVQEALDILRGAVTIVYPMWLPPHDVIRQEFENTEDLSGTQASLEVYIVLEEIFYLFKLRKRK